MSAKEIKMKRFMTKKVVAIGLTAGLVLGGAGVAYAYFTTGGTGTGNVTAASNMPTGTVTVQQDSIASTLTPGGSIALTGTVTNTSTTGDVYVASVAASIGTFSSVANNSADPACTEADFSITGSSNTPGVIAKGGTNTKAWSGLTLNMVNGVANQDNCKGISVPITYTAS